ncbi:MAG: hypothetical protein K6F94_05565 [Bacteroidaceae bacterium]|nr:hypothetical protein [Bacteroidaceae bacterium]
MKKSLFAIMLAVVSFACVQTANAQDNRDARRQEMQKKMMERVEKNIKLDDSKKAKFEEIYSRYQTELFSVRSDRQNARQRDEKKAEKLTDDEATARLQAQFQRQAEQIQQQQTRLEIQKKYCAEFSSVLTPQQLVILYQPQQERGNRQGGQRQGGQRQGGFGAPGAGGGFGGGF